MRKSLASVLLAAAPVLILSACNSAGGSNGVSALPNAAPVSRAAQTRIRPNDFSANDLHAGGATFPAYAYNLGIQPTGCALTGCSETSPGAAPALPQAPPGKGSLFNSAHLDGTVYYCLTGSGDGRKAFYGGTADASFEPFGPCAPLGATATGFGGRQDPLDFVGSDIALASTEYATYQTNREPSTGTNYGEPFEFPVIGGPVVYGYRPQDFHKAEGASKIRFSTWTYCAIANGTISNWNDPAITADNGGKSVTGGVDKTITFYFRSDGSGTSYNYINHLATVCGTSWPAPYNAAPYQQTGRSAAWTFGDNVQNWPGPGCATANCPGQVPNPNPNFIGENGNPGVLAAIQSTPFSTGYVEGAWAKSATPPVYQALLQSAYPKGSKKKDDVVFVDPTDKEAVEASFRNVTASAIEYGMGSDGLALGTGAPVPDSRPDCQLYINSLTTLQSAPYRAYPIIAVSYMMFYGNNQGYHTAQKEKLIKFMISAKANKIVDGLEYIALSPTIQTAVSNALNGTGHSTKPCFQ
jgi:ABC-type phosphate transport system substrate-binding protein